MSSRPDTIQTSFWLPRDMAAELREYRDERGINMSHIARVAIREYLDRQKPKATTEQAAA